MLLYIPVVMSNHQRMDSHQWQQLSFFTRSSSFLLIVSHGGIISDKAID